MNNSLMLRVGLNTTKLLSKTLGDKLLENTFFKLLSFERKKNAKAKDAKLKTIKVI